MTKMFAIPGIRLGYLAADPAIAAELKTWQSHWSTNAIALTAGELCMEDEHLSNKPKINIANERNRLFAYYQAAGICSVILSR